MPGDESSVQLLLQIIVIFLAMAIIIMTLSWHAHTQRTAEQTDLLNQVFENQALLFEVIRDILSVVDETTETQPASPFPDSRTGKDCQS